MRITFISPPFGAGGQKSKGLPIAPPVLEYLAGLTGQVRPGAHEVTLIDANLRDFDVERCDADLVGITVFTPQAPWVYRTADALRRRGIRVVLGGMHVTACPDEAAEHADCVVVGEAESVWGSLLDDAVTGSLQRRYAGQRQPLDGLPHPVTNALPDFYPFGSFFTSRGCPHTCSFCSVHEFFGQTVRMRPVDEVVKELAESRRHLFFNLDDNVWGVDVDRSITLFREMSQQLRRKWWFSQGDLRSVQHSRADELLKTAREAGLTAIMVGYESESPLVLDNFRAWGKQGRDRIDAIKKIRAAGIEVMLFVMLASREDTPAGYDAILDLCDRLDVSAHPVMTTPYPGTRLYEEYAPHLIGHPEWDEYDGGHALYAHDDPAMSVEAREATMIALRATLFSPGRIMRRVTKIGLRGFPMAHITSLMIQVPQGDCVPDVGQGVS